MTKVQQISDICNKKTIFGNIFAQIGSIFLQKYLRKCLKSSNFAADLDNTTN